MMISFQQFEVIPKYDGTQWTEAKIYESPTGTDSWTLIDTITLTPQADPALPEPIAITTNEATLDPGAGWYRVDFVDDAANVQQSVPILNKDTTEILASLDDVNANLDGMIFQADWTNTELVQISVKRVIKGYLGPIMDPTVLASWVSPATTPDIVREIAGKLIAAQLYFNETARTSIILDDNHYAQRLYTAAIAILNDIIDGKIVIPGEITGGGSIEVLSILDGFPIDDTDRAFTMNLNI